MQEPKIDPELESVCLPLSKEEFDLLEAQILRDGCQDALKVWDCDGGLILLDGHNRLKICKKHKLPYNTSTIEVDSIDEAIIWIVDNQKGRRNATKEQKDYISGKRYEAQKNVNRARDEKGVFKSNAPEGKGCPLGHPTAVKQAETEGIKERTVRVNAAFAKGVDAVKEVAPSLAEKILKPKPNAPKLTKTAVTLLPKLKEKEPEKFDQAVKNIEEALDTEDKSVIEKVVRENITQDEPTHYEKLLAKKHNVKPEHVRYARENGIPLESIRTIDEIDKINEGKIKACSTIWDGFYGCSCGIKFEIFGASHAPIVCPHCGMGDNLKRKR